MQSNQTPRALPRPTSHESFTAWLFRASKAYDAPDHLRKAHVRGQLKAVRDVGLDPTALANVVLRVLGERQAEASIPR